MRLLDNLAMLILLVAAVAHAAAHYMSRLNPATRLLGWSFACATASALGMLGILLSLMLVPGWQYRGPSFLALALVLLAAAGWVHRRHLPFLPRSPGRATD